MKAGKHSINVKKLSAGKIPYAEIATIPNSRKMYLDYSGELSEYMNVITEMRADLRGEQS